MTETIRIEGLTRRYGRTVAVSGVDLAVNDSEILGLVGPNGAGKTTTLRMLATLLVPSSGDAWIMGHSIRRDPDRVRRVIGYMPDSFGVYDDMRVWEYLDFFARCYSIPGSPTQAAHRGPAGAGGPGPQARRLRPIAVAGHAAAAVPRPHARQRPTGAAARRAGVRPRPPSAHRAARAHPRAARHGQDRAHQQPHPPRAGGAVHPCRHHRPRARPGTRRGRRDRAPPAARRGAPGDRRGRRRCSGRRRARAGRRPIGHVRDDAAGWAHRDRRAG